MADFASETMQHKARVSITLSKLARELTFRGKVHDNSKLKTPEKEIYQAHYEELTNSTFGSATRDAVLKKMEPAIKHHYQENDHHPEHFENGIVDMDLIQILEMLADIAAVAAEKREDVIEFLPTFMREKDIPENYYTILRNTLQRIVDMG